VYVAASRAEDRLILSGIYKPAELEPLEERKPSDTPLRRLLPALVERGFEGRDAEIAIPGPTPVDGSPRLPDATLEIRISEPGSERASELVRSFPGPLEDDPLSAPAARPPLIDARRTPVPVGHLSYSALALYEHCGYRFYVERVLGARQSLTTPATAAEEADEPEDEPSEQVDPGLSRGRALGIGNAVHAALEWSARRGWRAPGVELIEALLAREGLAADDEARARAERLITGWLESELRAGLDAGRPEVPFALGLAETVVRGQIDLLVPGDVPTVIDYKTDALDGRAPAELGDRYAVQRQVYALASDAGNGARAIHVFLDAPDDPVIEEFDPQRLRAARERLDSLVARMRGGEFEVTDEPYGALCHGCPAAARLCPRPAWRPKSA
jgi:ATP-dependent exoDNAse (exonuclease V) beta subunit